MRADWTFCKAGKVVLRKLPLYVSKKGSFPTATYLQSHSNDGCQQN